MRAWIKVGREKPMSARARSRRESRMFENVENEVACPERRASGAIAQIDDDEGTRIFENQENYIIEVLKAPVTAQ